ncbi:MAG: Hexokinase, partial [Streblomastix strix]
GPYKWHQLVFDAKGELTPKLIEDIQFDDTKGMSKIRRILIELLDIPSIMGEAWPLEIASVKEKCRELIPSRELFLIQLLLNKILNRSAKYLAVAIFAVVARIARTRDEQKRTPSNIYQSKISLRDSFQSDETQKIGVALDGSIFHKHKGYRQNLEDGLFECLQTLDIYRHDGDQWEDGDGQKKKNNISIKLQPTQDGSGVGSGLIASKFGNFKQQQI